MLATQLVSRIREAPFPDETADRGSETRGSEAEYLLGVSARKITASTFELLIQKRTMRPLDMHMTATAHFMHDVYSSFNEPLRIAPPR